MKTAVPRWAFAAVVAASLVAWWPTWNEPFAEDDFLFLQVADAAGPADLVRYFVHEGVMDHHYRPLSDPVWYAFASTPARYHAGLQVFHAASAVLVLSLGAAMGFETAAALFGALLWATRDFAFPSMIWASGFSDLGSTAFGLGAVVAYLAFRRSGSRGTWAASIVLFVAALLTKETAIVVLPLIAVAEHARTLGPDGAPRETLRGLARLLLPYALLGIPIAALQMSFARFDDTYGQALYRLSVGAHTIWLWPVYFVWSLAALPGLAQSLAARIGLTIVAAAAALVAITRRPAAPFGRLAWMGPGWFTVAILPALLAPARVNTNYVLLAAAGPCLAAAGALRPWLSSPGGRRIAAGALAAVLLVIGPALVLAKDSGRVPSGGWVVPARARSADALVEDITARVAPPDEPRSLTLVIFGAAELNPALLANLGEGFGPQSGLAAAFRRAYRRPNVRLAALPAIEDASTGQLGALREMLLQSSDELRVFAIRPASAASPPADLTAAATAAAADASGDPEPFRRALARAGR